MASTDDFQPPKQKVIRLLERRYFRASITETDLDWKQTDEVVRLACTRQWSKTISNPVLKQRKRSAGKLKWQLRFLNMLLAFCLEMARQLLRDLFYLSSKQKINLLKPSILLYLGVSRMLNLGSQFCMYWAVSSVSRLLSSGSHFFTGLLLSVSRLLYLVVSSVMSCSYLMCE